jgi:hypothetical protein
MEPTRANSHIDHPATRDGIFFPEIKKLNEPLPRDAVLVTAVGFEDRSLALLQEIATRGNRISAAILIQYEPEDPRNKKAEMMALLKSAGLPEQKQLWVVYERFNPEAFVHAFSVTNRALSHAGTVIVDMSAMSRFLVLTALAMLRRFKKSIRVIYSEAEVYHPTKEKFQKARSSIDFTTPEFLTSDVFDIVSASIFSSVTMQASPRLLIASPTFNPRELVALANELTPQRMFLLEGEPHADKDKWRTEAIWSLNQKLQEGMNVQRAVVSTFYYQPTLDVLQKTYTSYGDTHRLLLAPTGSKLQTLAIFAFWCIHPDVQIVYPATSGFLEEYTEGVIQTWQIDFPHFSDWVAGLRAVRLEGLQRLKEKIDSAVRPIAGHE